MLNVQNAVAVITGGSGGIGKSLAKRWLEVGGKAVIADVEQETLTTTVDELKKNTDSGVFQKEYR